LRMRINAFLLYCPEKQLLSHNRCWKLPRERTSARLVDVSTHNFISLMHFRILYIFECIFVQLKNCG
jgi:hypothetical protein